jgi:hypothetical protein
MDRQGGDHMTSRSRAVGDPSLPLAPEDAGRHEDDRVVRHLPDLGSPPPGGLGTASERGR